MRRQGGFTLLEVLMASAATGVVIAAATGFMLRGLAWYDELSAKVEMNRHAREAYDLMAYGGKSPTSGKDGSKNIYSLHGMKKAPPGGLRSKEGALQYPSNKLTLTTDQFSPMTIACTGAGTPIPDCKSATGKDSTQSVGGWIGSDIRMEGGPKSVNNRTVAVTFVITDAFEAQRAEAPALFSDTYRAIFTLNRDEDDPH